MTFFKDETWNLNLTLFKSPHLPTSSFQCRNIQFKQHFFSSELQLTGPVRQVSTAMSTYAIAATAFLWSAVAGSMCQNVSSKMIFPKWAVLRESG